MAALTTRRKSCWSSEDVDSRWKKCGCDSSSPSAKVQQQRSWRDVGRLGDVRDDAGDVLQDWKRLVVELCESAARGGEVQRCRSAGSVVVGLSSRTRGWRADADVGAARGSRGDSVMLRGRGRTSAGVRDSMMLVVGP